MNRKICTIGVFAVVAVFCAASVSAQSTGLVKVSNNIEGGAGGVSIARCGNNIVVGFGDVEPAKPSSFNGISISKDGGRTFTDIGTLPSFPLPLNPSDSLNGDQSIACANSTTFYSVSTATTHEGSGGIPTSAVALSTSNNGGASWSTPMAIWSVTTDIEQLFSPVIAVDPTNPLQLYVAYVDVNFGGARACEPLASDTLFVLSSSNGGKTWGNSQVDVACDNGNGAAPIALPRPTIVVSPGGKVYVAYEFAVNLDQPPAIHEIRFTRSLDKSRNFRPPVIVATKAADNALPQLAVDRTTSTHRGTIYLTWSGSATGTYTDILASESTNFGLSFSFPRPISHNPAAGTQRFQTNPVLAVDNDGEVAACFYQTPHNAPTSSSVYSYDCAMSFNHAATWQTRQVVSSAPVAYDAITSDFLLHNEGFFTAFELQASGKRHVVGQKFDLQ
jgi:hypothetical protein